jgi:hypothetical protein
MDIKEFTKQSTTFKSLGRLGRELLTKAKPVGKMTKRLAKTQKPLSMDAFFRQLARVGAK